MHFFLFVAKQTNETEETKQKCCKHTWKEQTLSLERNVLKSNQGWKTREKNPQ